MWKNTFSRVRRRTYLKRIPRNLFNALHCQHPPECRCIPPPHERTLCYAAMTQTEKWKFVEFQSLLLLFLFSFLFFLGWFSCLWKSWNRRYPGSYVYCCNIFHVVLVFETIVLEKPQHIRTEMKTVSRHSAYIYCLCVCFLIGGNV